jgi:hypothetical protein
MEIMETRHSMNEANYKRKTTKKKIVGNLNGRDQLGNNIKIDVREIIM